MLVDAPLCLCLFQLNLHIDLHHEFRCNHTCKVEVGMQAQVQLHLRCNPKCQCTWLHLQKQLQSAFWLCEGTRKLYPSPSVTTQRHSSCISNLNIYFSHRKYNISCCCSVAQRRFWTCFVHFLDLSRFFSPFSFLLFLSLLPPLCSMWFYWLDKIIDLVNLRQP